MVIITSRRPTPPSRHGASIGYALTSLEVSGFSGGECYWRCVLSSVLACAIVLGKRRFTNSGDGPAVNAVGIAYGPDVPVFLLATFCPLFARRDIRAKGGMAGDGHSKAAVPEVVLKC